jgi:hypothetical protein
MLFNKQHDDDENCESCCLPGRDSSGNFYSDRFGRRFTGHWVVEPGRHEYRTLVTDLINLPFDTTIHFIAVHLHPFSESVELRDVTKDQSVFKSNTRNYTDRIGLEHMDYYSSVEGLPLYKSHEYELVSGYNNTTTVEQDSMASMFFYVVDKEFKKPQ